MAEELKVVTAQLVAAVQQLTSTVETEIQQVIDKLNEPDPDVADSVAQLTALGEQVSSLSSRVAGIIPDDLPPAEPLPEPEPPTEPGEPELPDAEDELIG